MNPTVRAILHDDETESLLCAADKELQTIRAMYKDGTINTCEFLKTRNEVLHKLQEDLQLINYDDPSKPARELASR